MHNINFHALALSGSLFLLLLFSLPSNAEFTVKRYKEIKRSTPMDQEFMNTYINGVQRGLHWANLKFEKEKKQRLYCTPGDLRLNSEMILSLLDQEIDNATIDDATSDNNPYDYPDSFPVELMLVTAFINKFPCKDP